MIGWKPACESQEDAFKETVVSHALQARTTEVMLSSLLKAREEAAKPVDHYICMDVRLDTRKARRIEGCRVTGEDFFNIN